MERQLPSCLGTHPYQCAVGDIAGYELDMAFWSIIALLRDKVPNP